MPAKKIDPEEQKHKEKRMHVKRKLFFIASIAILVLITNLFMMYRSKNAPKQAVNNDEDVLGETAVLTEDEKARLQRVQKQASELVETVTSQTESYVQESKTKTEETLNEVIYRTTIRPLLEKIESLPEQQQEYVKEQLCRPELEPESERSGP